MRAAAEAVADAIGGLRGTCASLRSRLRLAAPSSTAAAALAGPAPVSVAGGGGDSSSADGAGGERLAMYALAAKVKFLVDAPEQVSPFPSSLFVSFLSPSSPL